MREQNIAFADVETVETVMEVAETPATPVVEPAEVPTKEELKH